MTTAFPLTLLYTLTHVITLITLVHAAPVILPRESPSNITNVESPIPLYNATEIIGIPDVMVQLRRSAEFTNAAYCSAKAVQDWQCGPTCDALGNITVFFTEGDNQLTPNFYVAYDPSIESVVLAQQGTDPTQILSLAVDADFGQDPLNTTFFPSAPPNTMVHGGFQKAFLRTVDDVGTQVQYGLGTFKTSKVLVTGHSLGAAISVMNGIYLTQLLGPQFEVTIQVFGLPRAGNSVWADFVDSIIGNRFLRMNLNRDPIPTIPPLGFLDYTHPSGEVFDSFTVKNATFRDGSTAVFCPGRENENCSAGNNLLTTSIIDHLGPYLTVEIGSLACSL
ncbi:alpha/beta-hydrolase [Serendipita vermifera]|nr:alpha/beta-hydrolase [Serendipita vermifera]